jgi:ABC-type branched-subunit amino acid transport system ATPase component
MRTSPAEVAGSGITVPVAATLTVQALIVGYGASTVVRGASLRVLPGTIAAIVGPNGSGKSTLLKAITGGIPSRGGAVLFGGVDVTNMRRDRLVRRGMAYVPQENEVFKSLTVRENLAMGGYLLPKRQVPAAKDRVLELFPRLARLQFIAAGNLSGGERKMLAIGRILMLKPSLVILDEPSANLSPGASEVLLTETVPALTSTGAAVLLVEQRALQALHVAHWAYVMVDGSFKLDGPAADVAGRQDIGEMFLGVTAKTAPGTTTTPADVAG